MQNKGLTLEEAIRHCAEVADGQTAQDKCPECAEGHRKLTEWLTDYKRLLEKKYAFDDEQEQINFVQKHKKIPVMLTASGDAISRQAVMDALCNECKLFHRNGEQICSAKCEEYHFLATLPPVNPMPKMGHWIDREVYDADRWKCSECGRTESYKENYCPNCGAKMQEMAALDKPEACTDCKCGECRGCCTSEGKEGMI